MSQTEKTWTITESQQVESEGIVDPPDEMYDEIINQKRNPFPPGGIITVILSVMVLGGGR